MFLDVTDREINRSVLVSYLGHVLIRGGELENLGRLMISQGRLQVVLERAEMQIVSSLGTGSVGICIFLSALGLHKCD